MENHSQDKIPLLLLKTKSVPIDSYEEHFSTLDNHRYAPVFVPVLEHRFKRDVLHGLREQILGQHFAPSNDTERATYGALIFTSQRAVEAFVEVVEEVRKAGTRPIDEMLPETLPLYVVGPATARGLRVLNLRCPILGEETGNGEALAAYILQNYNTIYPGSGKPHIMFLVGDKRRDIIARILQSEDLGHERRSIVDEVVIYETGEMHTFKVDFSSTWRKNANEGSQRQWVVVFSPTGCEAMLESLGFLDPETGTAKSIAGPRNISVATIGPTTRDYLVNEFNFTPDVCAEKPSPEGIAAGIRALAYKQK